MACWEVEAGKVEQEVLWAAGACQDPTLFSPAAAEGSLVAGPPKMLNFDKEFQS